MTTETTTRHTKGKTTPVTLFGISLALFSLLGATSPAVRAQSLGTWTLTGSMTDSRLYFTATLLPSGEVLVAGGRDNAGNVLSGAELYDPATGVWTPTGSMTSQREEHSATLLPSGQVLVAGGQASGGCSGALSSAELYDPATGTWTPTAGMSTARVLHVSALITSGPLSGIVLVSGGSSVGNGCLPVLATSELYDPASGTWSPTGSMTVARYFDTPSPLPLPDDSVLVVGGTTCCPYYWYNEADLFDSSTQIWTATSKKATTAQGRPALMPDGRVLVAGGVSGSQSNAVNVATAELFDPSMGTWTATDSMSTDRSDHTLTLLAGGPALAAGGFDGGWGVCNDLASAELYDSGVGKWFLTGSMNSARYAHAAIPLPDGEVLVAGGVNCEGTVLSSAELYTPPSVLLSSSSLDFGSQLVYTASAHQRVTFVNAETVPLNISSIVASDSFFELNDCGSSLAAGANCNIAVFFLPHTLGTITGTVTITDSAPDSPQTISLTGAGTIVGLSPSTLNFSTQTVGTTSAAQTITMTNHGYRTLSLGFGLRGSDPGDFAQTNTCGNSLAAGASCTISVTFTPQAKGSRTATLDVVDNGGGSPQTVVLKGYGT